MFGDEITRGLSHSYKGVQKRPQEIYEPLSIKNFKVVSSYSWLESPNPTIAVPGAPAVIKDVKLPITVPRDEDTQVPSHPSASFDIPSFAPAMAAVQHAQPDYKWSDLDILADRNSLRALFQWLGNRPNRWVHDFRIDLQLVGNKSVIFNSWNGTKGNNEGHGFYPSYSNNFEEAYLCKQDSSSLAHYRIVEYDFNGLKILLRYEIHACLPEVDNESSSDTDISSSLGSPRPETTRADGESPVKITPLVSVVSQGAMIPQERVATVITRSHRSVDVMNWFYTYPNLFLSQTAHLHMGIHENGCFDLIHKFDMDRGDFKTIHLQYDLNLRKLRTLLESIIQEARAAGCNRHLSLVCRRGLLTLHNNYRNASSLPEDHLELFGPTPEEEVKIWRPRFRSSRNRPAFPFN